jgi:putative ABC transport system ATP-binding protein
VNDTPAVVTRGLEKVYGEGDLAVRALAGVDLEVRRGELVVLLGPSGSGKTTLLNVVGAIDHPTHGSILVDGVELVGLDRGELTAYRRDKVGFVFQFFNLVPTLTALENVELIASLTERGDAHQRSLDALASVGLAELLDRFPAQLSGGQQQRVAIARAIAKETPVLLCDEPTGALDAKTGKLVLSVLDQVNRETGTTTAIITHNVAIAGLGDRVIHMRSGEITQIDTHEARASLDEVDW